MSERCGARVVSSRKSGEDTTLFLCRFRPPLHGCAAGCGEHPHRAPGVRHLDNSVDVCQLGGDHARRRGNLLALETGGDVQKVLQPNVVAGQRADVNRDLLQSGLREQGR